jgi:DNA-binding PadR family transcriptional regulator
VKAEERDQMCKVILELVSRGYVHWSDLHKKVLGSCHPFATPATFASQLRYLLQKGFIERESRGVYQITETGKKYLEII